MPGIRLNTFAREDRAELFRTKSAIGWLALDQRHQILSWIKISGKSRSQRFLDTETSGVFKIRGDAKMKFLIFGVFVHKEIEYHRNNNKLHGKNLENDGSSDKQTCMLRCLCTGSLFDSSNEPMQRMFAEL